MKNAIYFLIFIPILLIIKLVVSRVFLVGGDWKYNLLNIFKNESGRVDTIRSLNNWRKSSTRVISYLTNDIRPRVRMEAAIKLGQIKDPIAVEPLINALSDNNTNVRIQAALALGQIGDEKALEPLCIALTNYNDIHYERSASAFSEAFVKLSLLYPQWFNRDEARTQITKLVSLAPTIKYQGFKIMKMVDKVYPAWFSSEEAKQCVVGFIEIIKKMDYDYGHVDVAAELLGKIKDQRAIDALNNIAGKGWSSAIWALGELKNRRSISPLIVAITKEDKKARAALEKIDPDWINSTEARDAVLSLSEVVLNHKSGNKVLAATLLGEIKDPRACKPLVNILGLMKCDRDGQSWWYKEESSAAKKALVEIGLPSIHPLIEGITRGNRNELREEAYYALKAILLPLKKMNFDEALELHTTVLRDSSQTFELRAWSASALGELGDPRAIKLLEEFSNFSSLIGDKSRKALERIKEPSHIDFQDRPMFRHNAWIDEQIRNVRN